MTRRRSGRDLYLEGAATFLRLPKLAAALEAVPANRELHVHFDHLDYIDHACLDLLDELGEAARRHGRQPGHRLGQPHRPRSSTEVKRFRHEWQWAFERQRERPRTKSTPRRQTATPPIRRLRFARTPGVRKKRR